jgi:beta-lactamase regulating signal transducer with metallopeptidase domain
MNLELLCRRVLEALVNGGYQGLLLAALVLVALLMMRRSSASTRHQICLLTLLLVALLPAAHFARSMSMLSVLKFRVVPAAGNAGFAEPAKGNVANIPSRPALGEEVMAFAGSEASEEAFQRSPAGAIDWFAVASDSEPQNIPPAAAEETVLALAEKNVTLPFSDRQCVLIVLGLAAVGLIRCAALVRQLWMLRLLKLKAERAPDELQARFREICAEMKLRRNPTLLVTEQEGPCAVGFWRPAVIMPRSILGSAKAEAILRHELAHIDRRDDWASLYQQMAYALFFFHPAVWMLARRLSMEREIACDDHVLSARPNRRDYALLLTEFAGQAGANRFTAAPAAWGRKTQLRRRIDMILNKNRNASPRASRRSIGMISAAALLAAVLAIGFAPRIAVAQPAEERAADEEAAELAPPRPVVAPAALPEWAPAPSPARRARVAAVAGLPGAPGIVPYVAAEPVPPAAPEGTVARRKARTMIAGEDASVERRLDRLEKMIEDLVASEKGGFPKAGVYAPGGGGYGVGGFGVNPKEMARMQKEMERAHKDIERAAKELHGKHQSFSFGAGHSFNFDGKNAKAHRKALEAHRKALEKQIEKINEQLTELEQEENAEEEADDEEKSKEKEKAKDKGDADDSDSAPEKPRR